MAYLFKDLLHTAAQIDQSIDDLASHIANGVIHITAADREAWNAKASAGDISDLQTQINAKASTSDLSAETLARQNADAEQRAALAAVINSGSKNLLNSWDAPAQAQPINGITWTVDPDDGTITANGLASANSWFYLTANPANIAFGVETILTGCPEGGSDSTWEIQCAMVGYSARSDYGEGSTQPANYVYRYVACCVRSGQNVTNLKFKPMICYTAVSKITDDYVPYAPSNTALYKMLKALQT